ncbi:hypothetical protein BC835DRAFT_1304659 [Cytidiella melzeri]|nr:hypothetical protein BC835DRAFT_1304659 [Cytidiella melzeri]
MQNCIKCPQRRNNTPLRDASNSPMATSSIVTYDAPQPPYTEIPTFSTAPTIPAGSSYGWCHNSTGMQNGGVGKFSEGLTMEELAAQFHILQAKRECWWWPAQIPSEGSHGPHWAQRGKKYNMILATVRKLVHAAQLDLSCPYCCVSAKDLSKIFVSARCIHLYLDRFEGNWATAAIVKQFMSSACCYGKQMQYFRQANDNRNTNVM